MMNEALYWIGLIHVAAYAFAGGSFLLIWVINAACKRYKLGGTILRMYQRVLNEERANKVHEA